MLKATRIVIFGLLIALAACTTREDVVEETYADKAPKLIITYEGDGEEKIAIAKTHYYETGQKEYTGEFDENGKRHGEWRYWYSDGKLWSVGQYHHGKRHGISEVYFSNGRMRYKGSYEYDKQIGEWIFYEDDGSEIKRETH